MDSVKKYSCKIILNPIRRKDLYEYVGKTIYRLSGPVTIRSVGNVIAFTFNDHPEEQVLNQRGQGFYIPVAYVVNRIFDEDERFIPLRVDEYARYHKYIARYLDKEVLEYLLLPGLSPGGCVTKILIINGYGTKVNPWTTQGDHNEVLSEWPLIDEPPEYI